jgi:hypothetical protein
MSVETQGGLSVTNSYIRVTPFRFKKDREGKWSVRLRIVVFKDAETAEADGYPLNVNFSDVETLSYPLTATENIIAWSYTELKKLPEFVNAVGV